MRCEAALGLALALGSASAFAPGYGIAPTTRSYSAAVDSLYAARVRRGGVLGLKSALQNADKVNRVTPRNWKLGTDFVKASKLSPGDLVVVERSDGTRRYGEVR
jgi:hypothetical protein